MPDYPADQPAIAHVDINSYFATILQQENPHLRGKPIGVLKDHGRSCIIAASKEAKTYGVKTGSRLAEATQLCPQLVTVPAAFDRCQAATKQLKDLFAQLAPTVTIYSLDEAFIDVSDCRTHLYPDLRQFGRTVQHRIQAELGEWVTANVGISYNRFLAKMASETAAPNSVTIVTPDDVEPLLATTGFNDVCGVGYRLAAKLNKIGVTNLYQLRFIPDEDLNHLVGSFWTRQLRRMSLGEEPHTLQLLDTDQPHMKSVGRSITGFSPCTEEDHIRAILYNLVDEVTHKARQMDLAGRFVSVKLYGRDDRWRAHRTLTTHIRHTTEMFDVVYHQLYRSWQRSFPIIKFAVRLGKLKPLATVPVPWFPQWHQQAAATEAVDELNHRYGLFTVRSGRLLNRPLIKPEITGFLGDKIYHQL